MKCPKCNKKAKASATRFIEYSHAQRRIRTCECGFKFTTYERIEADKQDLGKSGKERKKEFYRKVLKDLIEDLEGKTYLHDPRRDSTLWEEV
jgi:transcriptional repressor NrdR